MHSSARRAIVAGIGLLACVGLGSSLGACKGKDTSSQEDAKAKATPAPPPPQPGFDTGQIEKALEKIGEMVETPGPFEDPDQSANFKASAPHFGVLELGGSIGELEVMSWSGEGGLPMSILAARLSSLAKDANVTGLLVRIGGLSVSLPDAEELRAAMMAYRKLGKQLHCHAEELVNASYVLASACDTITLSPLGEVVLTGPSATPIHLKGLLDRLDVAADFLHVGAYKGAAEPLTRREPSSEMKETLAAILDNAYVAMKTMIATSRGLELGRMDEVMDRGLWQAEEAVSGKLVDKVATYQAWRSERGEWRKLDWEQENPLGSMMRLLKFLGMMPSLRPIQPHIAVVYAVGNIEDGAGDGLLGAREVIAAQTLVPALRVLAGDDSVKAVVLRIDSGGGSAKASELIWQELSALAAKKPLVVSMSDVAASGGYYIAAPATRIFALPTTLTGSIGVVAGKLAPGKGLAKLGIESYPMGRGKHATLFSSLSPWTSEQRAVIEAMMSSTYKTFVGRVATGRKKTPEDVEPIAQGRVWTGEAALKHGLVDELGGLDAAIAFAQKTSGVEASTPVEVYPPEPTVRDLLVGMGGEVSARSAVALVARLVAHGQVMSAGALAELREGRAWREVLFGALSAAGVPKGSARQLAAVVESFAHTHFQTVALLPRLE